MRYLYTILLYLCTPFILLRLLWRARKNPEYAKRWNERFGCFSAPDVTTPIWVHAVSLGEVNAAVPLIKRLLADYADQRILVTTMTVTGSQRVRAAFGKQVEHVYLPYDFPDAIQRFLNRVQPKISIFMETELWPNLITVCNKNNIAIMIANARLSQRSAQGYQWIAPLVREMLSKVTVVAAQTEADAQRFIDLGSPQDKVKVLGNIKFDMALPDDIAVKALQLRQTWGEQRPVFIAASTHENEEAIILQAFAEIKKDVNDALLILVPRHPERFAKVIDLVRAHGYAMALRSENLNLEKTIDVFIGNTVGELLVFYAAADVAFVGGSLVAVGGHNLLEPAALSLPILTGSEMFNFTRIYQLMIDADAVITVTNAEQIANTVKLLFADKTRSQQLGENAHRVFDDNRGAVEKHVQLIKNIFLPIIIIRD